MQPAQLRSGLLAIAAVALVGLSAATTTATAAPTKPSLAHQLQVGVPYSSSLPSGAGAPAFEWLRLPEPMGPGDKITFASDADNEIRYCLAPAVDDFAQLDTQDGCEYEEKLPTIELYSGKYRRTLKWTGPPSHGFLLVSGEYWCCEPITTVYSVMVERIEHYKPDFTPPAFLLPDRKAKIGRHKVAKVRITCPASEASPPCSGTLTLKSRRRNLTLAKAKFVLGADQTSTVSLRLDALKTTLLMGRRKSLKTRLIASVRDKAKNRTTLSQNLKLVR